MKSLSWILLPALMVTLVSGCRHEPRPVVYSGFVQGTTFNIRYFGHHDSLTITNGIDSIFRLMDATASLYDSGSVVSRLNRNEPVEINPLFVRLFRLSETISERTAGTFDITVGPLVRAWGFYRKQGKEPSITMIDSLKSLIGYRKVTLTENGLIKEDPRFMLDFNAIAQGLTVDLVSEYLDQMAIENYLVEIGGEVRTKGLRGKNEPWRIGIERPSPSDSAAQEVGITISLSGRSVATSGNYRKYFIRDGRKFSHTIDPAKGAPVEHHLLSVSVVAGDCATADALATACMVMGPEKAKRFLEDYQGVEGFFVYSDESGALLTFHTTGFENYIYKEH